jgi:hypothetical protein
VCGQVVLRDRDDAPLGVVRVGRDDQTRPCRPDDVDAAASAVDGVCSAALVQVPHDQHGSVGGLRERLERRERAPDVVILRRVDATADVREERVDHDQADIEALADTLKPRDVGRELDGPHELGILIRRTGDSLQQVHDGSTNWTDVATTATAVKATDDGRVFTATGRVAKRYVRVRITVATAASIAGAVILAKPRTVSL